LVSDIGVRKKPSEERGPKPIIAIRQPQIMITRGVRQVAKGDLWADLSAAAGIDIGMLRYSWLLRNRAANRHVRGRT